MMFEENNNCEKCEDLYSFVIGQMETCFRNLQILCSHDENLYTANILLLTSSELQTF